MGFLKLYELYEAITIAGTDLSHGTLNPTPNHNSSTELGSLPRGSYVALFGACSAFISMELKYTAQ